MVSGRREKKKKPTAPAYSFRTLGLVFWKKGRVSLEKNFPVFPKV
jgi:hypothetical protein